MSDQLHVLVIGATGSIGRLVVEHLLSLGDTPRALTRDVERAQRVLPADTDVVAGDLSDDASLREALQDIDAVVMTHGAPYGSGGAEAIDYGAVPAVLDALDGRSVPIALMSSIGVTGTGGSSHDLLNWKRRGERVLRVSGLPYTVVRPGWFDAGTGSEQRIDLRQGDQTEYGPVRREHVAQVLSQAIHTPKAIGRTIEVFSTDGAAITDWPAAFGDLRQDTAGSVDGSLDAASLPMSSEPATVQADLRRWQGRFAADAR